MECGFARTIRNHEKRECSEFTLVYTKVNQHCNNRGVQIYRSWNTTASK